MRSILQNSGRRENENAEDQNLPADFPDHDSSLYRFSFRYI